MNRPAAAAGNGTKRPFPRVRRFAAVLALCGVVLPTTGFWVNANDAGRSIRAVRVRINFDAAMPEAAALSLSTRRTGDPITLSLSLDRARYRATLRNMPKPMPENPIANGGAPKQLMSMYGGQVVLALNDMAYLPLSRISTVKPSQEYRFWSERGTFLPADGLHRNDDPADTHWLTDARYKLGETCETVAETSLALDMQRLMFRINTPLALQSPHPKSAQYKKHIENAAKRFGLSPRLIYAIMRTESAFNPFAVSNAGALGLMQVVPDSAGNEVQTYLTGKAGKPTISMLFDPKSNIEHGSAYLHLLATRYFSGVVNSTSRELCMIAGYNAGPRAVFRAFNTNNAETATNAINALSPDELFTRLSRRMPAEETRQYVGKVVAAFNAYPE